jgi:hypothetical protein
MRRPRRPRTPPANLRSAALATLKPLSSARKAILALLSTGNGMTSKEDTVAYLGSLGHRRHKLKQALVKLARSGEPYEIAAYGGTMIGLAS